MKKKEIKKIIKEMYFDISKLNHLFDNEIAKEQEEETIDYNVNWKDAPKWAEFHAYDKSGIGYWYGPHIQLEFPEMFLSSEKSGWKIGASVMHIHKKNWKSSIVPKPLIF
jgi:hypothetical protein